MQEIGARGPAAAGLRRQAGEDPRRVSLLSRAEAVSRLKAS